MLLKRWISGNRARQACMLRVVRLAPLNMDPELGNANQAQVRRRAHLDAGQGVEQGRTTASLGNALLVCFLVLLFLGILPATLVFWVCIVASVFACIRVRIQAQQLHDALQQEDAVQEAPRPGLFAFRGTVRAPGGSGALGGGSLIRVLPGGGGMVVLTVDPNDELARINMRLRQLDEELGYSDQDLQRLMRHAAQPSGPPPITDTDLATLPVHAYKPPRRPATSLGSAAASTSVAPAPPTAGAPMGDSRAAALPADGAGAAAGLAAAAGHGGPGARVAGGSGRSTVGSRSSGAIAVGEQQPLLSQSSQSQQQQQESPEADGEQSGLVCPVCLDHVSEGSMVMTLPCLHQFHSACVTPWLRQQGTAATCPMCKTQVFR